MIFTNAAHPLALIVALIPFASACFNGEDVVDDFASSEIDETGDGDPGDGDPGDGDPGDGDPGDPGDPFCGDGNINPGEECDDGNPSDTDACTSACTSAVCGDGIVHDGAEECDDGNNNNADACLNNCTAASCGDAYVWLGNEECDDGGLLNNDGCDSQCEEECVPAQQGVKFDFENVQPGGGLPLTLTAPASWKDAPFVGADFRWTDLDGYHENFGDHGVQAWGWWTNSQIYNGRTGAQATYYYLDLVTSEAWTLTGLSFAALDNNANQEVQIVAFQNGAETLLGTFHLCSCGQVLNVPFPSFSFAPGSAQIRLKPVGDAGAGYFAIDNIQVDFCK
jgi:cysteine-rich repeat protein